MERTLKFDIKMNDNSLARDYLKKNEIIFRSIGFYIPSSKHSTVFYYNDHKFTTCDADIYSNTKDLTSNATNLWKKLRNLAVNLQENEELFSELGLLATSPYRSTVDEIKNFDVKLMSKNFIHCSSCFSHYILKDNKLIMTHGTETPVCKLGLVAQMLLTFKEVYIVCATEYAPLCHLFTDLCHQVGLFQVKLYVTSYDNLRDKAKIPAIYENRRGVGIITERSDVESAVNAFIYSSFWYPWSLRHIFVQESIYETTKKLFAWKSEENTEKNPALKLCSESIIADDKLFVFDYLGDIKSLEHDHFYVIVQAYRTTKELLSLIKTQDYLSMSLWSSDVAEANEIAFGANVGAVWVNEIASFDGPPAVSQTVYSPWLLDDTESITLPNKELSEVKMWSEFSAQNRITKITKAMETLKMVDDKDSIELAQEVERSIIQWKSSNFVDVQNNKHVIGTVEPLNVVCCMVVPTVHDVITSLIDGQGIVFCESNRDKLKNISKLFEKELPIWIMDTKAVSDAGKNVMKGFNITRTKVVSTNFGTIFAN